MFRILNAIFVVTYFNPDEFWQSLEIAHRIVFGSGFTTWEWSEQARIRGAAHPFIFVPVYFLLKLLGWDSPWMTAYSPRIIQAVLAAVGDVFLFKFARKEFGKDVAFWTVRREVCVLVNV